MLRLCLPDMPTTFDVARVNTHIRQMAMRQEMQCKDWLELLLVAEIPTRSTTSQVSVVQ